MVKIEDDRIIIEGKDLSLETREMIKNHFQTGGDGQLVIGPIEHIKLEVKLLGEEEQCQE